MLSIPILVYLFSLDVITASSYSLFIVGTTSLTGAWLKQKELRLNTRAGITFGISSAIAIFCMRTWIIPRIPEALLIGEFMVTKHFLIMSVFVLLAIASIYCYDKKLTFKQINNLLFVIGLPIIATAFYLFLYTSHRSFRTSFSRWVIVSHEVLRFRRRRPSR